MPPTETTLFDAQELRVALEAMARQIADGRMAGVPLRLIGIRSRGVPLAERLAAALTPLIGEVVRVGAVDITLYRDDLGKGARWPVLRGTDVPFAVDGKDVVLVDDVLYSGRTVRAALNAICDLGRPARIRLAVLVDRGERELPIQPDVVGKTVTVGRGQRVRVRLAPVDPTDEIVSASES
ncbi:MAG: bifunctional pyr operon transcriptional regulator/uracil phosphoribosyltransferase PyrR [Isosphaeraceae bacterium]|nr:bifunctional pyr operon transcriptional regulator/uracil phosphoribosyltransferase PyrR [Isosphaeraceae bacterium]